MSEQRLEWVRAIKVGDVVCTCQRRHLRVTRIEDVIEPKSDALAVATWTLGIVSVPAAVFLQALLSQVAPGIVAERIVYFADGTNCHATSCLDPPENCLHD